jgi:transposase
VNFAAIVNPKMPHVMWLACVEASNKWIIGVHLAMVLVDNVSHKRQNYIYELSTSMPTKNKSETSKVKALLEEGTLNRIHEKVRDRKFQENEFFDPRDIVQVKYEMLRRVSIENTSVTGATEEYGVSRPTYYQTKAHFDQAGLAGLVPRKRGPRGPHKLQGDALAFVEQQLVAGEPVRARELAKLIRQKFDLYVHPRTIERAVAGKKTPR